MNFKDQIPIVLDSLHIIILIFISWTVGLLLNNLIKNAKFYSKLSNFNFLKSETTARYLGLHWFKWVTTHTVFKYFNQKLKFDKRPSVSELKAIRKEMSYSEISHFIAFIFILITILITLFKGRATYAFILFFCNIIFNLYPSLLQQQNKKRIDKLLKK